MTSDDLETLNFNYGNMLVTIMFHNIYTSVEYYHICIAKEGVNDSIIYI